MTQITNNKMKYKKCECQYGYQCFSKNLYIYINRTKMSWLFLLTDLGINSFWCIV